jgi:hypothetical protein
MNEWLPFPIRKREGWKYDVRLATPDDACRRCGGYATTLHWNEDRERFFVRCSHCKRAMLKSLYST